MNKVILMGRLTKEPEVKCLQNEDHTVMTRYIQKIMYLPVNDFWKNDNKLIFGNGGRK